MKLKIIMDSGKEYTIDSVENSAKGFFNSCFEKGFPQSYTWHFNEGTVLMNPTHISSIEELEDK